MSSNRHEVISALLDDEPFDAEELADALNDPAGRALLIDLAVLRRVVQPPDAPELPAGRTGTRSPLRAVAAAAMLIISLFGAYLLGQRISRAELVEAPEATRVVQAEPFDPTGGAR